MPIYIYVNFTWLLIQSSRSFSDLSEQTNKINGNIYAINQNIDLEPANLIRTGVKVQFSSPQIDELDKPFEFQLCGILLFNHYHCSVLSI